MDYKELEKILSEYVRRFAEFDNPETHDEGYKWRAISHFQRNWDIEADRDSFLQMFRSATAKQVNLFDGRHQHPLNGIRKLLRGHNDYEFIYQQFSTLFSGDDGNYAQRQERAQLFVEAVNNRVRHFYPAEDGYDHSLYDAINYLSFWRPAENFICKPYSANKVAGIINFGGDIGYGAYFSLAEYYKKSRQPSITSRRSWNAARIEGSDTHQSLTVPPADTSPSTTSSTVPTNTISTEFSLAPRFQ